MARVRSLSGGHGRAGVWGAMGIAFSSSSSSSSSGSSKCFFYVKFQSRKKKKKYNVYFLYKKHRTYNIHSVLVEFSNLLWAVSTYLQEISQSSSLS